MIRVSVVLSLWCLFFIGFPVSARPDGNAAPPANDRDGQAIEQRARALDRSIDEILNKPAYQWRMPRDTRRPDPETGAGVVVSFLRKTLRSLGRAVEWIADTLGRFMRWVSERLFRGWTGDRDPGRAGPRPGLLNAFLWLLLLLILACLGWLGLHYVYQRRERRRRVRAIPGSAPPGIDLNDATVRADRLPVPAWLAMARDLEHAGESRLAVRALFLAALAALGQQGWIRIASHKSNWEYRRELEQRARTALSTAFTGSVRLFERTWYGDDPVSPDMIPQCRALLERILHHADG